MDLRTAKWAYVTRDGERYLCVNLDDDRIAVLLGSAGAEVWYPDPELSDWPIEPIQVPDVTTLATALTGIPEAELQRLQAFCSEARTMDEIEEEFEDAEAWYLRKLGILREAGKKGRKIACLWAGIDFDVLMDHLGQQVSEAIAEHDRKHGR